MLPHTVAGKTKCHLRLPWRGQGAASPSADLHLCPLTMPDHSGKHVGWPCLQLLLVDHRPSVLGLGLVLVALAGQALAFTRWPIKVCDELLSLGNSSETQVSLMSPCLV
jgi:hypothetical protein